MEWTKNHLDSLVNVYMADCGNLLDPDMTRDLLKCIGYTRLNVFDYREASWLIDSVVFIRLMDRAEAANNKTILFTMGMYGCGKTTSLNNNPDLKKLVSEVGVVSSFRRCLQQREILRRDGGQERESRLCPLPYLCI